MIKILVSACLLGEKVRFDGGDKLVEDALMQRWHAEARLVPICPEMAGGLPTPRPPAEIQGGTGVEVLAGDARVTTPDGTDVSAQFIAGAERTVALARASGARLAILKARSPSCGSVTVYDGSFASRQIPGRGVAAAALAAEGIAVFDEDHLAEAAAFLARLEAGLG